MKAAFRDNVLKRLSFQNESEAVGLVGVDGVGVHRAGAPAVVSADSVDPVIDIDIDVVPGREVERMPAAFKVIFAIRPCPEVQLL